MEASPKSKGSFSADRVCTSGKPTKAFPSPKTQVYGTHPVTLQEQYRFEHQQTPVGDHRQYTQSKRTKREQNASSYLIHVDNDVDSPVSCVNSSFGYQTSCPVCTTCTGAQQDSISCEKGQIAATKIVPEIILKEEGNSEETLKSTSPLPKQQLGQTSAKNEDRRRQEVTGGDTVHQNVICAADQSDDRISLMQQHDYTSKSKECSTCHTVKSVEDDYNKYGEQHTDEISKVSLDFG